jgi:hypothetical protein
VTGHWIEETSPGVWDYNSALMGFLQMNTAHDGVRLGRALFKIVRRLGFSHKVLYYYNFSDFIVLILSVIGRLDNM